MEGNNSSRHGQHHGSPDGTAKLYTFSEEIIYDTDDSIGEDVSDDEISSYALESLPRKRPKNSTADTSCAVDHTPDGPDLISLLPDSVVLHILSFLPTINAVATGVLSKRWRNLWTAVPTLMFRFWSWHLGLRDFVDFVSRTLTLYGRARVKKFYFDFEFHEGFQCQVDAWVRFATRHDVEELYLDFYGDYHREVNHFKLPQFIYKYGLLNKLKLSFCEIMPDGSINWGRLKTLYISYATLSDALLETIILGSPVLESLELYECCGFHHLDLKSSILRKLVIHGSWGSRVIFVVSGPKLQSLSILGFLKHCWVKNVSSLVDVALNFQLLSVFDVDYEGIEMYGDMLMGILENLVHVKKLTIGQWCMQVLSACEMKELSLPISKRNYLILDACLNSLDVPGIVSLLQSSPDLETLVIIIRGPCSTKLQCDDENCCSKLRNINVEKYLNSKNMNFKNSPLILKTVDVAGFEAEGSRSTFAISLLGFLLENARLLERLTIHPSRLEDVHKVGERLLHLPRSSPHAEIVIRA